MRRTLEGDGDDHGRPIAEGKVPPHRKTQRGREDQDALGGQCQPPLRRQVHEARLPRRIRPAGGERKVLECERDRNIRL